MAVVVVGEGGGGGGGGAARTGAAVVIEAATVRLVLAFHDIRNLYQKYHARSSTPTSIDLKPLNNSFLSFFSVHIMDSFNWVK